MLSKVILVTGSAPPDACGVGDYVCNLASSLEKAGLHVDLLHHKQWGFGGTFDFLHKLRSEKNSLPHIQYPTMGYGHSLGPQLGVIVRDSVVTLHEFSLAHPLRQLSLLPFTLRSRRLIMTSEFERRTLVQRMPWADKRIQIIPIGSNIVPIEAPPAQPRKRFVYHGLIMPRKGLEDFLEMARLARAANCTWEVMAIGRIPSQHTSYAKSLMADSTSLGIQWILDKSLHDVSALLAEGGIAYLPFPDGASERRGSLKTVLAAAMPCITTHSEQTTTALSDAVVFAATPQQALQRAFDLIDSESARQALSQKALAYSKAFSWETIAASHIQMYEQVARSSHLQ